MRSMDDVTFVTFTHFYFFCNCIDTCHFDQHALRYERLGAGHAGGSLLADFREVKWPEHEVVYQGLWESSTTNVDLLFNMTT